MNRNIQKYIPFSTIVIIVIALLVSLFCGSLSLSPVAYGGAIEFPGAGTHFYQIRGFEVYTWPRNMGTFIFRMPLGTEFEFKVLGEVLPDHENGFGIQLCPQFFPDPYDVVTILSGPTPCCPVSLHAGEHQIFSYKAILNKYGKLKVCPQLIVSSNQSTIIPCGFDITHLANIPPQLINVDGEDGVNLICDTVQFAPILPTKNKDDSVSPTTGLGGVGDWPRMASNVVVTNVFVQPQQAVAKQKVTVFGSIANRGDLAGDYEVTLKVNGQVETVKSGSLVGHQAIPLKFTIAKENPGTYEVDLNGQRAFFTIAGEEKKQGLFSGNSQLLAFVLWGILVLAVLTALTIVLIRRKQSYY